MNPSNEELWLIRTSLNHLSGPYPRETVVQKIKQGELSAEDEVCRENDYWITLNDTIETQKHLGVSLKVIKTRDEQEEETTEAQLEQLYPSLALEDAKGTFVAPLPQKQKVNSKFETIDLWRVLITVLGIALVTSLIFLMKLLFAP